MTSNNTILVVAIGLGIGLSTVILRSLLLNSGLIEWGDLTFHKDISVIRNYYFNTWNSYTSGDAGWSLHLIPIYLTSLFVSSTEILQRVIFFTIFTMIGSVSFFCTFKWLKWQGSSVVLCYVGAIVMALMYTLNPWVANRVGHFPFLLGYALFPLVFYLTLRILSAKDRKVLYKFSLTLGIILSISTASFTMFVLQIFLILYLMFISLGSKLIKRDQSLRSTLKNALTSTPIVSLSFLLLFAYWILPSFVFFYAEYSDGPWWGSFGLSELNWISADTHLLNVMRSAGYWWTDGLFKPSDYLWSIWIVNGLILFILSLASIFLRPRDRNVIMLVVLIVILVFLSKGNHEPLGEVYEWFILESPVKGVAFTVGLHDPDRWSALLSFATSLLFGITIAEIFGRLWNSTINQRHKSFIYRIDYRRAGKIITHNRKILGFVMLGVVVFSISINGYPLLSGNLTGYIQPRIIPEYYHNTNRWLESHEEDFRVYWLPQTAQFNWINSGIDPHPSLWLSSKPVLQRGTPYFGEFLNFVNYEVAFTPEILGKVIGMANVKYLIFHSDTVEDYNALYGSIETRSDLNKVYTSGPITVFENKHSSPYIYALHDVLLAENSISLMRLSLIDQFIPAHWAVVIPSQQKNDVIKSLINNDNFMKVVSNGDYLFSNSFDMSLGDNKNVVYLQHEPLQEIIHRKALIPESGKYRLVLNLPLEMQKDLIVKVDGIEVSKDIFEGNHEISDDWYYTRALNLTKGAHDVDLIFTKFRAIDAETIIFWTSISPPDAASQVLLDKSMYKQGETSIKWSILSPQSAKGNRLIYDPPENRDFAKGFLGIWLRIDETLVQPPEIHIFDTKGNYYFYVLSIPSVNEWMRLVVPIDRPNGMSVDRPDLSAIDKIELRIYNNKDTNIWIDDITNLERLPKEVLLFFQKNNQRQVSLWKLPEYHTESSLITYSRLNPSEIIVNVNTSKPFIMAFSESYSDFWQAYVDGHKSQKVFLYPGINGFIMDKVGSYSVKLQFEPENFFRAGVAISGFTVVASSLFLIDKVKMESPIKVFLFLSRVRSLMRKFAFSII